MSLRRPRAVSWLAFLLLTFACAPLVCAQSAITMSKSFNPASVTVGGTATTTMTVTITNPNGASVSGIAFSDTYPAGLVPDQVGAYTCNAGSAVFSGTGWAFNNVTLGAGASCSVPVLMHATAPGQITNTTSQVTGTGVLPGGPASAVLNATAAPVLPEIAPLSIPALTKSMLVLLALSFAAALLLRREK